MASLSKVLAIKCETLIKMWFNSSKLKQNAAKLFIYCFILVSHLVVCKSSCLSWLCEVGYQTRHSYRQIRQTRNPVGAFCLSFPRTSKKHPVTHTASWLLSAIMQINLVEKKNCQPRAGYNYDPPICDLSILQALIDFDTPFCSVRIRSEYNTFSASEFKQQ